MPEFGWVMTKSPIKWFLVRYFLIPLHSPQITQRAVLISLTIRWKGKNEAQCHSENFILMWGVEVDGGGGWGSFPAWDWPGGHGEATESTTATGQASFTTPPISTKHEDWRKSLSWPWYTAALLSSPDSNFRIPYFITQSVFIPWAAYIQDNISPQRWRVVSKYDLVSDTNLSTWIKFTNMCPIIKKSPHLRNTAVLLPTHWI